MIKDCEHRHENGNCLFVGGFCTSVTKEHCVKEHDKAIYNKAIECFEEKLLYQIGDLGIREIIEETAEQLHR